MPQDLLTAILIALGIVVVILAIWLLLRASNKTTVVGVDTRGKDVLDDGAERASRNQALIDAPTGMAKEFGQTSANANSQKTTHAGEDADAEAGASVPPTVGDPVPPPLASTSEPSPIPAASDAQSEPADDLRRIKGVGPKLASMLAEQGVISFSQIAGWSHADIERVDSKLGRFAGRISRDHWVEQARLLSAGDESAFEAKFGSNG